MNGIFNAIFVAMLFFMLVAFAWLFSIGDLLETSFYNYVSGMVSDATLLNSLHNQYVNNRELLLTALNHFMIPFLLFMTFTSSFVNRNQTPIQYFMSVLGILLVTPLLAYLFSEVISNLLFGVSFIDADYCFTTFMNNFVLILVLNMLASLASFVFVQKQVSYA